MDDSLFLESFFLTEKAPWRIIVGDKEVGLFNRIDSWDTRARAMESLIFHCEHQAWRNNLDLKKGEIESIINRLIKSGKIKLFKQY